MKAGIAGAGLMGRLLALALIERGWHVTLFDRDDSRSIQSCGMTAAGLLAPLAEITTAESIIYTLGLESIKRWPEIIKRLNSEIYFQQTGSLLLAHRQDRHELDRFINQLNAKLTQRNIVEKVDANEIAQLEPELKTFSSGYYLPIEGQIDNQHLLETLGQRLVECGVDWHENCPVEAVKPHQMILANHQYEFDWVFDCRGLGAKNNFPNLRGVRGEIIWLKADAVNITRPVRLMHPKYRLYVVPRPDHIYLIGASEIESEDQSPVSVQSALELLSAVYSLHPGFAEARIIDMQSNCRPALPNNLPKIIYQNGMIALNGLYRHGFLLAPALVDRVLELIAQDFNTVKFEKLLEAA